MSAYAPNPSSSVELGAASLTASLLARKGEALPAVDAQAHEGVDIDVKPVQVSRGARPYAQADPIQPGYPANPVTNSGPSSGPSAGLKSGPGRGVNSGASRTAKPLRTLRAETISSPVGAANDGPPENWTIMPSRAKPGRFQKRRPKRTPAQESGRKATITFKMPAKDFIRLRFAARELEMSCQSILLDALDSYLDANDVAPIPDDICEKETARLIQKMSKARRAR